MFIAIETQWMATNSATPLPVQVGLRLRCRVHFSIQNSSKSQENDMKSW